MKRDKLFNMVDWLVVALPLLMATLAVFPRAAKAGRRIGRGWRVCIAAIAIIAAGLAWRQQDQIRRQRIEDQKELETQRIQDRKESEAQRVQDRKYQEANIDRVILAMTERLPQHFERNLTEDLGLSEHVGANKVPQSEVQRRLAILTALRAQYGGQSYAGVPSKEQWPPLDWINQRLQELKQPWAVVQTQPGLEFREAAH
ncbi:MAG: hypothetical protein ABSC23_18185 [Bryobacteraceae bacterium]|jgi:hypothetical protein